MTCNKCFSRKGILCFEENKIRVFLNRGLIEYALGKIDRPHLFLEIHLGIDLR